MTINLLQLSEEEFNNLTSDELENALLEMSDEDLLELIKKYPELEEYFSDEDHNDDEDEEFEDDEDDLISDEELEEIYQETFSEEERNEIEKDIEEIQELENVDDEANKVKSNDLGLTAEELKDLED